MFLFPLFPLLVLAFSFLFLFALSSSRKSRQPLHPSLSSSLWSSVASSTRGNAPSCHTCHMCGGLRLSPSCQDDARHLFTQVFNRLRSVWRTQALPEASKSSSLEPRRSSEPIRSVAHPSSEFPLPPSSSLLLEGNPHAVTNAGAGVMVPSASSTSSGTVVTPISPDMSTKGGTNPNDAHRHRVILEILMSPPANPKGEVETRSDNASGLRLKLETNTTLEHLTSLREVLARQCTQKCKSNGAGSEGENLFCLPVDSDPGSSGKCDHQSASLFALKINPEMSNGNLAVGRMDLPLLQQKNQKPCNEYAFVPSSSNMAISDGNLNIRAYRRGDENGHRQPFSENADEKNDCTAGSEGRFLSQDCLGSLQIAFYTAPQATQENLKVLEMDGPAVSALAAINVTNKSERDRESDTNGEDNSGDAIGDCQESSLLKASEQSLMNKSASKSFEGDASSCKRERKKKKNRARKQKEKLEASVVDAQEIQNIGKVCLEAVKHISTTSEKEVGCICGTPKGGVHTSSCPYPFTSSGSILQRKIKEQYDELVRCNAAKTLTLAQVGRFTTRLVETKATLQQKSELIQRKFTITKSLLSKADKSSFDRLWGQIYGLEMEQKKLEEDTVVYNRLQEQLKLSPAYKKMLEYGRTHLEVQPHSGQLIEKLEPDVMEMSFEEFLAQEKKDVYWQKHGFVRAPVQAR